MRVLLIQYQLLRDGNTLFRLPSLALGSLAANVDRSLFEVEILETYTEAIGKLRDDDNIFVPESRIRNYFREEIRARKPDVVGLATRTTDYYLAAEIAKIVREESKDITIILGGYHATGASDEILSGGDRENVDFLIRGEGEAAFDALLKALYYKNDFSSVPNLSYRSGGEIIHTPDAPLIDLESGKLKTPARGDRTGEKKYNIFGIPVDIIETSRGCVFDCNFCSIRSMYGRTFRRFAIERVIGDIADARKHGAKAILIADDNITIDLRHVERLCDAIIEAQLNDMLFFIQASVKGIVSRPDLIPKMVRAGIRWVFLGIESPDNDQIKFMMKANQFKSGDIETAVTLLRKHGIFVHGGLIFGTPDETEESIRMKYEYVKKLKVDYTDFYILTPFPGTKVREELDAEGLLTNVSDYSRYNRWHANVRTRHLSAEQLHEHVHYWDRKLLTGRQSVVALMKFAFRSTRYSTGILKKLFWVLFKLSAR